LVIGDPAGTAEAAAANKIKGPITFGGDDVTVTTDLTINNAKAKVLFDAVITNVTGIVTIERSYVAGTTAGTKADTVVVSFGETTAADPDTKLITPKVLTVGGATVDIENSTVSVEDAIFNDASAAVRMVSSAGRRCRKPRFWCGLLT
jgi:hypothetical protein